MYLNKNFSFDAMVVQFVLYLKNWKYKKKYIYNKFDE